MKASPNHWTTREFPGPWCRERVGLESGLVEDVRWLLFQTSGLLTASELALPRSCLTPWGVGCGMGQSAGGLGPPPPVMLEIVEESPQLRTAQGGSYLAPVL